MAFTLRINQPAADNLKAIRAYNSRRIIAAIDANLISEPAVPSRNRKCLDDAVPPFEHVAPIWELRVGEFRVYYDVDSEIQAVFIRRVRHKKAHMTTEDVFNEKDDA